MANTASDKYVDQIFEQFDHDIRNTLAKMSIIDLGTIGPVGDEGTCTVYSFRAIAGERFEYHDVEILYPFGIGIAHTNDICLVLVPNITMASLKNSLIELGEGPYGISGAKAIPMQYFAQRSVSTGINSTGAFTIQGNGVSFTVADSYIKLRAGKNSYVWDNTGKVTQNSAGGLIDTGSGEGELSYKIYTDDGLNLVLSMFVDALGGININATEFSEKVAYVAIGDNKIRISGDSSASEGMYISLEDANGNTLVMNGDGIKATDFNKNSITLDKNGITTSSASLTSIGNSTATIGSLLQDLSTILQSLGTVGSQTAQSVDPTTIASLVEWGVKVQQVLS